MIGPWILPAQLPGAGADFVMMGGMLAGHDQCSGQVIEKNGKKYKLFYGMSSTTAMKKYVGGVAEYRWVMFVYLPYKESGSIKEWSRLVWLPFKCHTTFTFLSLTCLAGLSHMQASLLSAGRASEGKTVEVPYRGDVEDTVRDVLGGLRSTCTYVGAAKLKELSKRTTFIRVTQQASQMFT